MKTKEDLEREINETAREYFSLGGDNIEVLKDTMVKKLFALVFEYCRKHTYTKKNKYNLEKAGRYYLEIHDCLMACIRNYDPQEGIFIHYLNRSIKYKIHDADNKEIREDDKTLPADPDEKGESIIEKNGKLLPEPLEYLFSFEETERIFDIIENTFNAKQERVKLYLSALLTARLYEAIIQFGFRKRYTFINTRLIMTIRRNRGQVPSQKEVAESFNRLEADASRTMKNLFDDLRENPVVKESWRSLPKIFKDPV